ncbi:MAG: TVP38/TMEM64 family protein [Candidatus Omnitrophica bacterium]|nr:TVP38/TMEM64 family protein [Candidatus Omnitrophota bacterium]
MNKITRFIILVAVILVVGLVVRYTPLSQYFTKEQIVSFLESLRGQWWGPFIFIAIYSVGCVVALPGSLLTLAGGAVFGTAWGTLYNVIASNLGASLAFFAARYLGRDFVKSFLKGGKLAELDEQIGRSGFKTIFRLRLIPIVPFNGLNFGAGFSAVRYRDYLLASVIGMLPGTFIYTYFADALLEGVQGASRAAFLNLILAGVLLIFISFLPSIYKKIKGGNSYDTV